MGGMRLLPDIWPLGVKSRGFPLPLPGPPAGGMPPSPAPPLDEGPYISFYAVRRVLAPLPFPWFSMYWERNPCVEMPEESDDTFSLLDQ